jgi:cytochrome c
MRLAALIACLALPVQAADFATLEGHGGPVMAVAVDGDRVLTASFDYSVALWQGGKPHFLEGHRAAVNSVAFLGADRAISGGDDFALMIWDLAGLQPLRRVEAHKGKIMAVRVSPDQNAIASASWDGTIGLWAAEGDPLGVIRPQAGAVNDVAFSVDGKRLWSAAANGTLTEWSLASREPVRVMAENGFGINRLAVDEAAGWIAYGGQDGTTRVLDLNTGEMRADLSGERKPILALALSPDRSLLAIGDGQGWIMVVATADWSVVRDFHAALHGPIWALAFTADGTGLIAGGIEDRAFVWPLASAGDDPQMAQTERAYHTAPSEVGNGERQFLRKCSVCHSLADDEVHRAGPSLHGLFGRKAGSLPDYPYSPAMRASGITWTAETVDKLFDLGPETFTPGSKMPMQRIARPQDRADLIAFLQRRTAPANE